MKIIRYFAIIGVFALMTTCVSTAKFPISKTVPAADITATKKQDDNKNYVIELTAKNLAEANRLNPQMNNYSVWIVIDNGTTKNIGQLTNKNGQKAVLVAVTPYDVKEIFITAEEKGDLSYPAGVEISRTKFN
ncbi:MAG TPA: hypothetical protein DEA97_01315 [Bacteroidales bacterium]|nr:hypothetical protein [Bacteroidales bacterium]